MQSFDSYNQIETFHSLRTYCITYMVHSLFLHNVINLTRPKSDHIKKGLLNNGCYFVTIFRLKYAKTNLRRQKKKAD
jgi:hypothetical protein